MKMEEMALNNEDAFGREDKDTTAGSYSVWRTITIS
jgi:hypothetical protein